MLTISSEETRSLPSPYRSCAAQKARRKSNREEEEVIHKLKVLGLALVAVFAMSAVAVSGASAATPGELTSDGTVTISGTSAGEKFTFEPGQESNCNAVHTVGTVGVTPHTGVVTGTGITTLTDQTHYSN